MPTEHQEHVSEDHLLGRCVYTSSSVVAGTFQFRYFEECTSAEQSGRRELDCQFIVEASFPLPAKLESCDD
jgi:hypothetical protein